MRITGSGGGQDLRSVPYKGPLKGGDWVEYASDWPRHDDFFGTPVGIEFMEGSLAHLINLRGEVTSIDANAIKAYSRDNLLARSLPAFDLTSVPGLRASVELIHSSLMSDRIRAVFEDSVVHLVELAPQKGTSCPLATVVNDRGESAQLGVTGLKRADLPVQVEALLRRQKAELCAGSGLGEVGQAFLVGGVRLPMRSTGRGS